jgi:hypothetical protein
MSEVNLVVQCARVGSARFEQWDLQPGRNGQAKVVGAETIR